MRWLIIERSADVTTFDDQKAPVSYGLPGLIFVRRSPFRTRSSESRTRNSTESTAISCGRRALLIAVASYRRVLQGFPHLSSVLKG